MMNCLRCSLSLLVLLVLAISPILAQDASTVALPLTSGPYAVGRADLHVIDPSREDPFAPQAGTVRELMVRLYYPAQIGEDDKAGPYLSTVMAEALETFKHFPADALSHVYSHAYDNAPIDVSGAPYPLLLFSPGYNNSPLEYAALHEEMASDGYIVAAISHTYTTDVTVFPGDRIVYSNYSEYIRGRDIFTETPVWQADHESVLQHLEALNTGDGWLASMIDFNRIGAYGHSFGGPSLFNSAGNDPRIRAVVNLDGGSIIVTLQSPVAAAYMFIQNGLQTDEHLGALGLSPEEIDNFFATRQRVYDLAATAYNVEIPDIIHASFLDWVHYWPLMPDVMPAEFATQRTGSDTHAMVTALLLNFFEIHLNDGDVAQWDVISQIYPDIVFEVHEP